MLSARNQFKGVIKSVKLGEVMAEVVVTVDGVVCASTAVQSTDSIAKDFALKSDTKISFR